MSVAWEWCEDIHGHTGSKRLGGSSIKLLHRHLLACITFTATLSGGRDKDCPAPYGGRGGRHGLTCRLSCRLIRHDQAHQALSDLSINRRIPSTARTKYVILRPQLTAPGTRLSCTSYSIKSLNKRRRSRVIIRSHRSPLAICLCGHSIQLFFLSFL